MNLQKVRLKKNLFPSGGGISFFSGGVPNSKIKLYQNPAAFNEAIQAGAKGIVCEELPQSWVVIRINKSSVGTKSYFDMNELTIMVHRSILSQLVEMT